MNKLWIAAPVVLLAAAAPYFTGPQAEKAFRAGTTELNQYFKDSGLPVKVAEVSYDKGFLSSQAVNRIELTGATGEETDPGYCVELTTELNHGYLPLFKGKWGGSKTTIRAPAEQPECTMGELFASEAEFANFYQQAFDADGPFVLNSQFAFSGGANIDFTLSPFAIDETIDSEAINVAVKQMQGSFDINSGWDSFSFDLNWPGMTASGQTKTDKFEFSLGNYSATGYQHLAYPNLWVGSVEQTIGEFKIHNQGADKVNMSFASFAMAGDSSIEDNNLHSSARFTLQGLAADDNDLGNLSLNLDVSRFDAMALDNLMGTFKELLANLQQGNNPDLTMDFDQQALLTDLKKIADSGVIEIKSLEYSIGENNARVDGAFNLTDLAPVPAETFLDNPLMLINHLKIKLNAGLDEKLVRDVVSLVTELDEKFADMDAETKSQVQEQMMMQFTQFAQNFTQSSYLLYDAEKSRYSTTLRFENGEATVNEQPFGIPNLGS